MRENRAETAIDVLLVEDNPGDARLTREAFDSAGFESDMDVVSRGEVALDYLHGRGDYQDIKPPNVVLLDLNLPGIGGLELLEEIKTTPELRHIPVVILSSSADEDDVDTGYRKYANAYLTKPVGPDDFAEVAKTFGEFWARTVELPPRSV